MAVAEHSNDSTRRVLDWMTRADRGTETKYNISTFTVSEINTETSLPTITVIDETGNTYVLEFERKHISRVKLWEKGYLHKAESTIVFLWFVFKVNVLFASSVQSNNKSDLRLNAVEVTIKKG